MCGEEDGQNVISNKERRICFTPYHSVARASCLSLNDRLAPRTVKPSAMVLPKKEEEEEVEEDDGGEIV